MNARRTVTRSMPSTLSRSRIPFAYARDRVVGARFVGAAMAEEIGGDDGEWLARARDCTLLHVVELSPIPWISSIAGPEPAIRYARR